MSHFTKTIRGVAVAALTLVASSAFAQQELKIMAPAGPGGGWDSAARSIQQVLTQTGLAKSVQVTNVTGAGGTIGLAQFVNNGEGRSEPAHGQRHHHDRRDPQQQVAGQPRSGHADCASHGRSARDRRAGELADQESVKELAAAAKADPAKVTWAGGSAGGADHILAALFTKAAGSDPAKVNYIAFSGGGEALAAMLGGRVTAGVSGYGEFESQIKAGKLRALAISSGKRLAGADVPTLKEQGMDVEVVNWRAIMAAAGHHGGPAQGACRDRREAGQVEGMGRDPQAARLGGFLPRGSAFRSLPQGGTGSRRRHPEVDRPREVLRNIEGAWLGLPLSLPHSEACGLRVPWPRQIG